MSPIRVDFYLLDSEDPRARYLLACKLLEKAYLKGHRVYVFCQHQEEAELLDELLWTFKEESFIPHNLQGEGPKPPPPIQLGFEDKIPLGFNDILVNLSPEIPNFFGQFRRIIELVSNSAAEKEQGRVHYKIYRSRQCALSTHAIEI